MFEKHNKIGMSKRLHSRNVEMVKVSSELIMRREQVTKLKSLSIPEIAINAATRGAIGFGAGLLLADKLKQERRKTLGWSLFLSGLASTIPIAMHIFRNKDATPSVAL
jgi:hypothetical protein